MPDSNAVNGLTIMENPKKFISSIDRDDPLYQQNLMRPATIKEDVNLMSQKQRVSLILNSDAFRRELEEIIRSQSVDLPGISSSLLSLQHMPDLFLSAPNRQSSVSLGLNKGYQYGVIPINDLRGSDVNLYCRRERTLRCKVVAVYRLIDLFGWNTSIHNHVTVRLGSKNEHFLINPFGLLYHEVTASSLIKVDSKGQILDPGSTVLGLNEATWMVHLAVHLARADIRCIIHIDTPATIAVSCMKTGLLPICNEAMILGDIAYYTPSKPFVGMNNGDRCVSDHLQDWIAERTAIAEALGPTARVLFWRSYGLLALGETIEEAWHYATNAVVACDTQLLLASLGTENLILPSDKLRQKAYETWRTAGLGGLSGPEAALAIRLSTANRSSAVEQGYSSADGDGVSVIQTRPWRLGELEFEAMMRHLDNAGFRTGFHYRQEPTYSPHRTRRAKTLDGRGYVSMDDQVRVPPTASSVTATMNFFHDDGILSGDETDTQRRSTLKREWYQKRWLNTPNKYTREYIKASPAHLPVQHWVSDRENAARKAVLNGAFPPPAPFHPLTPGAVPLGSTGGPPTGTTSFSSPYGTGAPQGSNPKEYRDQQRKVKAKYYHDTNTAGPQSRLLEGLTWDEARRVRDEGLMKVLGPKAAALVTQGVTDLPVAAASKAIIQRDVRNAAVIYDGLYSHQNPFEKITDEELEMYRREIELKNNPELITELERRGLLDTDTEHLFTTAGDSLAVDSGATDLESTSDAGPSQLSPPLATGTLASEPSYTEDVGDVDEKQHKKKRRFKLFSLTRSKTKGKDK